jgi:hypothetical protein
MWSTGVVSYYIDQIVSFFWCHYFDFFSNHITLERNNFLPDVDRSIEWVQHLSN